MTEISIFPDKAITPTIEQLRENIGASYEIWKEICDVVSQKYPGAKEEWNYPGKNYGWSFRIKDKKRAIIYLLPHDNYFKVAFVFGQKAFDEIMNSTINQDIKNELNAAIKYVEGRGIRIAIRDNSLLNDVKQLVDIKLKH